MVLVKRYIVFMRYVVAAAVALSTGAITVFPASAQSGTAMESFSADNLRIEPNGHIWIEGSASVVDYRCHAEQLSGNGRIENTKEPQQTIRGHGDVSIRVSIPVHTLECGKKAMDKDMYHALKADRYPNIHYQLIEASRIDSAAADSGEGWIPIRTKGLLEIAGVQDTTTIIVKGKLLSAERFRVKGSKELDMKTFDITPPSALFGLIKASRRLNVFFDVTVRMQ